MEYSSWHKKPKLIQSLWTCLIGIGIVATILLIAAIRLSNSADEDFIEKCNVKNGNPYHTEKDWLCLTEDGRVIRIDV